MTIKRLQLFPATQLTATTATLYTVPAGVSCQVAAASATLDTSYTGSSTVSFHVVPSGGSASIANKVATRALMSGNSYALPELTGQVMPAGSTLQASGLNIVVVGTGVEFV